MEKVRPWCGQPSDRGRLRNRNYSLAAALFLGMRRDEYKHVGWDDEKTGGNLKGWGDIDRMYRKSRCLNKCLNKKNNSRTKSTTVAAEEG